MEKFQNKQQKIIDATISLLANEGLQNFSIRKLAKALEIRESTIYHYFPGKDEIIDALLDSMRTKLSNLFDEIDSKPVTSLEKIRLFFESSIETFKDKPEYIKVFFFGALQCNGEHLNKVATISLLLQGWLHRIITEGQIKHEIRNNISASHISLMINGILNIYFFRTTYIKGYNPNNLLDEIFETIKEFCI